LLTGCVVASETYTPVPRRDLTEKEERQLDRYCKGTEDPCEALRQAARTAIIMAQVKMGNMLRDDGSMFGTMRWTTHANDLNGRLDNIAAIISLGQKSGCDMSKEVLLAAALYLPAAPL
jgi:hypothetical protein